MFHSTEGTDGSTFEKLELAFNEAVSMLKSLGIISVIIIVAKG